ncbi:hypothetical protein MVEN_01510300 [Mycena venus]|uniref:FAD/NAD(P)-binding domain-containing protein n=1 Tax=Mycena venus TaxID=2733690 RepID=A0A8H6XW68_9AGAR|nr:hypothetical protein MVEN_01510300 [Mycena venus]
MAQSATSHLFGESAIDAPRPMRVVVVGAGFSGIIAGIRFLQHVPNVQLTIYEALSGIGGTWFANKYPGLACDIPAHCYQLTFHEKTDWSSFYARGLRCADFQSIAVLRRAHFPVTEIQAYLESVVDKYNLRPFIQLEHRLTSAVYSEATGKWNLTIQRPNKASEGEPDGETGEGDVSSPWEDTVESWKDKRVGVIGVGSSAIQIVPALQPKVRHLNNYVRGKTWISSPFLGERAEKLGMGKTESNYIFTDKDKELFKDPAYYKEFRRDLESDLNSIHVVTLKGHPVQEGGRAAFKADMLKRLETHPAIAEHLIPDFPVGCRRLTPGPGYLEAICQDNVEFIPTEIKQILPNGIERVDGKIDELDIISLGPNSAVGSGSLLIVIERQVQYAVEATLKLQREHLKSMDVKPEAVADWDAYIEHHFAKTVFSERCRSWYKQGMYEGRVVALWPGSCLHAVRALEHPRWEDYTYEPLDGHTNRFFWAGNGTTIAEETPGADRAWYLSEGEVDFPPVPLH